MSLLKEHRLAISSSAARANLPHLIDQVNLAHTPVVITGKRHNAVLIGEDDWRSIQETLYLLSVPEMRESLMQGVAEPIDTSSTTPLW